MKKIAMSMGVGQQVGIATILGLRSSQCKVEPTIAVLPLKRKLRLASQKPARSAKPLSSHNSRLKALLMPDQLQLNAIIIQ